MTEPRSHDLEALTPELLLRAYTAGIFPMAESRSARSIFWVDPLMRGILPLDDYHVPRRLRRTVRGGRFEVSCDSAFTEVMRACAEPRPGHPDSWINEQIIRAYSELHDLGFAHSIECWHDGGLAGGLYGVSLGGAFFGESMFSRATDASKVALVHLLARLKAGGFVLLDVQFLTDHLAQFGVVEVPARDYLVLLGDALRVAAQFPAGLSEPESDSAVEGVLRQSSTHTS